MAGAELLPEIPAARDAGPKDLSTSWGTFFLFWGAPLALAVAANAAYSAGWPVRDAYAVWIGSTVWFGLACLANALRCGRVHCWVDGTGMPVLAAGGALSLAGFVPLAFGWYAIGFWGILVASFCLELCWRRYT